MNGDASTSQLPQNTFSTPPNTSIRREPNKFRPEGDDDFLNAVGPRGINGEDGNSRLSRLALSPPPPPGPPPTEPPPLPPTSAHPYSQSSRSSIIPPGVRAPARISTMGLRKSSSKLSDTGIGAGSDPVPSTTNPPISPRSSSLMSPVRLSGDRNSNLDSPVLIYRPNLEDGPQRGSTQPGPRTPSRHLLQTALDLAQRAVEMDKNNDVSGALVSYREAVARLKSVMERVGVVETGEDGRRRKMSTGKSEEEGRTLRGIHDAYVARIALLSNYEDSPSPIQMSEESTPASTSTTTLVPNTNSSTSSRAYTSSYSDGTPRPSLEDTGVMGIGNLMLGDRHSVSSIASSRSTMPPIPEPQPGPSTSSSASTIELGRPPSLTPQESVHAQNDDRRKDSISSALGYETGPNGVDGIETLDSKVNGNFSPSDDERPLPPLPNSAPSFDSNGRLLISPRTASLQDDRRTSNNSFLVSPTTAQGTISQRRRQNEKSAGSIGSLSEIGVPKSETSRTISRILSNGSLRLRAKSEAGKRPLFNASSSKDVPPVPSIKQKPSLSTLRTDVSLAPPVVIQKSGSMRSAPSISATSGTLISPLPEQQPIQVIQRPFHLLRILYNSMDPEKEGAYLTGAIHISSAVWRPTEWSKNGGSDKQPKIAAQEVKGRVIEMLVARLEEIREKGLFLVDGRREYEHGHGRGASNRMVDEFCVALDGLEDEMESAYKALVGKGVVVGNWRGKKTGGGGLSWGSRISRSMDKMTNGKNLDSPDRYVDLLSALCYNAQVINEHLDNIMGPCTLAYSSLSIQTYEHIHVRINRAAEFVGAVVTPFVMDDFKQFLLRYLKSGVRFLEEG